MQYEHDKEYTAWSEWQRIYHLKYMTKNTLLEAHNKEYTARSASHGIYDLEQTHDIEYTAWSREYTA